MYLLAPAAAKCSLIEEGRILALMSLFILEGFLTTSRNRRGFGLGYIVFLPIRFLHVSLSTLRVGLPTGRLLKDVNTSG